MNFRKLFRIHEDSSVLCVWSTGKISLKIIYDVNKPHFSSNFTKYSKESLQDYILNYTEDALYSAIDKIDENCYQINIAPTQHFHGPAGEGIYDNMLKIYMPVIQKFMVDVLTGKFKDKLMGRR